MHEDEIRKVQLELTGTERSLTGVLTLLGFLQGSAKFGTTQWVKLMGDGDGGFSIAIARDGAAWELSEEEANYLFAEPEDRALTPPSLVPLCFQRLRDARGEVVLSVELV